MRRGGVCDMRSVQGNHDTCYKHPEVAQESPYMRTCVGNWIRSMNPVAALETTVELI